MFTNYGHYYAVARSLGLGITPFDGPGLFTTDIQLSGWMSGRPVFVGRRLGDHPRTTFRVAIQPSLDLGLVVQPSSIVTTMAELVGAADVEVGDAVFDDAFAVRGDDPARVKGLLSPRLRVALMACAEAPLTFDDHGVGLSYGVGLFGITDDAATITCSLHTLLTLAGEIDVARAATPPPADVGPLLGHLSAFARERNLACAFDTPPRVMGKIGGLPVWVIARRRKKNVTDLEIGVRFEEPLGFSFSIVPARTGFDSWFGGADIEVGDAEFDRAFDIRSSDPARLVALLDAGTRRSLLDLATGRALRLDAGGVQIVNAARDFDPVALPPLIERAADMMKTLARSARLPAGGAYR